MSTIIFFMVLLVAWILPVTLKVKQSVNIMQHYTYQNESYSKWMNDNLKKVYSPVEILYLIPITVFIFFDSVIFQLAAAAAVFVVVFALFYATRPRDSKKMVYTPRVQRLFGVSYLMYWIGASVATVFGAFGQMGIAVTILILFALLAYYIVKLTNTVMEPLEQRINQRYVDDAKRLIKYSPGLTVVGITGNKETASVKHFLKAVLSVKYNVLTTPDNYQTRFGITRTVNEQLKPHHEVFIASINSAQEEDIQPISELTGKQYGIVAGTGKESGESGDSANTEAKALHEFVESLPAEGTAVVNKDDHNLADYQVNNRVKKMYYGLEREDVEIQGSDISTSSSGTDFTVSLQSGESEIFHTPLQGEQHVYNMLAAIAVGLEMNIPLAEMTAPLKQAALEE